MVIYSGTQGIFQISKWRAVTKITRIFGLVLKMKTDTQWGGRGKRREKAANLDNAFLPPFPLCLE